MIWLVGIGRRRVTGDAGEEVLTQWTKGICAGIERLVESASESRRHMVESLTYGRASRASASSCNWDSMNLSRLAWVLTESTTGTRPYSLAVCEL